MNFLPFTVAVATTCAPVRTVWSWSCFTSCANGGVD